ncbi:MAG: hypothetical protein ISR65_06385 [Bacteriovoracaceae bacterium]|nr:hypothetical protein [Bacteriovoracaceae bacterium]
MNEQIFNSKMWNNLMVFQREYNLNNESMASHLLLEPNDFIEKRDKNDSLPLVAVIAFCKKFNLSLKNIIN